MDAHERLHVPSLNSNHDIADTTDMFHPPSADLDHEALGLFPNDNPHEIHDEIIIQDHNFSTMMNATSNGIILDTAEATSGDDKVKETDRFFFEERNDPNIKVEETTDGNAKCEYCGNVGIQDTFYSKSKRFCRMECSKKYSALFQKKSTNARVNLHITSNRSNKRKIQRPGVKLKKQKLDDDNVDDSDPLPNLETGLQQVSINEINADRTLVSDEGIGSTQFIDDINEDSNAGSWIDQDFNWKDYLAQTGDKPASDRLFKHIAKAPSLSNLHVGMKIEVINDHSDLTKEGDVAHWIAAVINVDNNMLLLRYAASENEGNDFWIDIRSKHVHPVGWCYRLRKPLIPPAEFKDMQKDWQKFVFEEYTGSRTLSSDFMDRVRKGHYNKFEIGNKVEVSDKRNLLSMCVATIIEIVGDRLRLRYDGLDENTPDDYWAHFLSSDIHPVGWSQLVGHSLSAPSGWTKSPSEWNEFLEEDLLESNDAPQDCFVPESMGTPPSSGGSFEEGMKLEALDPSNPLSITVASVIHTLQFNYFVVGLDNQETYFICHCSSSNIFPVGWAKQHKLFLTPPKDYVTGKPFDWSKYLSKTDSTAAPASLFLNLKKRVTPFEIGTKVEAVDLREPSFICPATVVATHGNLLRIHFDGWDSTFDQLVSHDTLDIFPVHWCAKNNHPLQPPGALMPDSILDGLRFKKQPPISRRGSGHGRVGRPPGSLNKTPSNRAAGRTGVSGKAGGKAGGKGGKAGKAKRQNTSLVSNVPFERQRFGNLREMRKGGEVQFSFNQKCACGPFLNPNDIRKFPNAICGYLNGPPHQNCIRKSLHEIVNAACDPNQLLELFSREFYQSKKHKDLKLDNTVCLEITGKNGKRFLRRVRGPSRSGILSKYLNRICEMLQCCPYLIVEDRFPSGMCDTNCHEIYNDGSPNMVDSSNRPVIAMTSIMDDDVMQDDMDDDMNDDDDDDPDKDKDYDFGSKSNSHVTSSSMTPTVPLDSPCDPSSSSMDRGIDPLNLLDQEFLQSRDPREWSVQEVMDFMTAIGCPAHAPSFQKQEIDGKALFLLSFDELVSLTENKLGPITKLKDALQSLKKMWQIPLTSSKVTS